MAGLGLGPPDFALFEIDDPGRAGGRRSRRRSSPSSSTLGDQCLQGLARVAGKELFVHPGKLPAPQGRRRPRRCSSPSPTARRATAALPYLAVVVTTRPPARARRRPGRVAPASRRCSARSSARRRTSRRRGSPSASSAQFRDWNFEELPEVAPAHSAAFWPELGEEVAPGRARARRRDRLDARGGAEPLARRPARRVPRPVAALQGARERERERGCAGPRSRSPRSARGHLARLRRAGAGAARARPPPRREPPLLARGLPHRLDELVVVLAGARRAGASARRTGRARARSRPSARRTPASRSRGGRAPP